MNFFSHRKSKIATKNKYTSKMASAADQQKSVVAAAPTNCRRRRLAHGSSLHTQRELKIRSYV